MHMKRFIVPVVLTLLLSGVIAPVVAQQPKYQGVRGILTDSKSMPLAGHRVQFEPIAGGQSFLSQPTRTDGTFIISLPDGVVVAPVAVINPRGVRVELADEESMTVAEGSRRDISLPAAAEVAAQPMTDGNVTVTGAIRSVDGEPLEGYRVVFRSEGGYDVHVSGPADENGEYMAKLPVRGLFVPVAIIDARGHRRTIDDENPVQATDGARRDVTFGPGGRIETGSGTAVRGSGIACSFRSSKMFRSSTTTAPNFESIPMISTAMTSGRVRPSVRFSCPDFPMSNSVAPLASVKARSTA